MTNKLAQESIDIGVPLEGVGPLGLEGNPVKSDAGSLFNNIISTTIGLLTIIAAIWFILLFIMGAYGVMMASGDKAALESARKRLLNGVIGLVIIIAAVFIVNLIASFLGIEQFIFNPADFIRNVGPSTL